MSELCQHSPSSYTSDTIIVDNAEEARQFRRAAQNLPTHIPHDYGGSAPPALLRVMELKSDCSNSIGTSLPLSSLNYFPIKLFVFVQWSILNPSSDSICDIIGSQKSSNGE